VCVLIIYFTLDNFSRLHFNEAATIVGGDAILWHRQSQW